MPAANSFAGLQPSHFFIISRAASLHVGTQVFSLCCRVLSLLTYIHPRGLVYVYVPSLICSVMSSSAVLSFNAGLSASRLQLHASMHVLHR